LRFFDSFFASRRAKPGSGGEAFAHRGIKKQRILCPLAAGLRGGVAERSNAAVSKTVSGR
jgi:hypothetical protein